MCSNCGNDNRNFSIKVFIDTFLIAVPLDLPSLLPVNLPNESSHAKPISNPPFPLLISNQCLTYE